jgi:hypothetical protein
VINGYGRDRIKEEQMPRPSKGPRVYLDPTRKVWVLRYQTWFRRTPYREDQKDKAEEALAKVLKHSSWARGFRTFVANPPKQYWRPKRSEISGIVYFISASHNETYPIKIGFCATDAKKRLIDLQVGNPIALEILVTHPAKYAHEQEIHSVLSEHRSVGEWFNRTPSVESALIAARNGNLISWLESYKSATVP